MIEKNITKESAKRKLLFRRRIDKTTGCWIYTGTLIGGYGRVGIANKRYSAHRLSAFVFLNFDLSSKKLICHNCPGGDNPSCFNPNHLWVGTNIENSSDAKCKGQYSGNHCRGELNANAKLTDEKVRRIKDMIKCGYKPRVIAEKFMISRRVIYSIRLGKIWKHVV